jgi:hypothetical protein
MHLPINVKSPNNISKWQMGFNSAFKGLTETFLTLRRIQGENVVNVHRFPCKVPVIFARF